MNDEKTTIKQLKNFVYQFVAERNWTQHHTPKNLAMAISIEAAELMEKFQWIDNNQSVKEMELNREEITDELADILAYVMSFAYLNNIDLSAAVIQKMEKNSKKYPLTEVTGTVENVKQLRKNFAQKKEFIG